jgi:hypothetical protein
MVTVGLSGPALAAIAGSSVHGSRRIRTFSANPDSAVLDDLADHVTSGALRPVVHSVYPLTDIAVAHEAFERGGVTGNTCSPSPRFATISCLGYRRVGALGRGDSDSRQHDVGDSFRFGATESEVAAAAVEVHRSGNQVGEEARVDRR